MKELYALIKKYISMEEIYFKERRKI